MKTAQRLLGSLGTEINDEKICTFHAEADEMIMATASTAVWFFPDNSAVIECADDARGARAPSYYYSDSDDDETAVRLLATARRKSIRHQGGK